MAECWKENLDKTNLHYARTQIFASFCLPVTLQLYLNAKVIASIILTKGEGVEET